MVNIEPLSQRHLHVPLIRLHFFCSVCSRGHSSSTILRVGGSLLMVNGHHRINGAAEAIGAATRLSFASAPQRYHRQQMLVTIIWWPGQFTINKCKCAPPPQQKSIQDTLCPDRFQSVGLFRCCQFPRINCNFSLNKLYLPLALGFPGPSSSHCSELMLLPMCVRGTKFAKVVVELELEYSRSMCAVAGLESRVEWD